MFDSSLDLFKYLIGEYWGNDKKKNKLKSASPDNELVKTRFVYDRSWLCVPPSY